MYRSPREAHEARIHTAAYRVYGTLYLVPGSGTADLLNQERPYLPVTGALVYGPGFHHPPEAQDLKASLGFLALRKERIQWVVGGRASEPRTSPSLFSQAKPFQTLWEARLYLLAPDKPMVDLEPRERFPFVTLNLRLAEGVAEAPGEVQDPRLTLFG